MKMTEHFTFESTYRSQTARRLGINNKPTDENILLNIKRVCEALELIRAHYKMPVNIRSLYRSPALNRAVGGSINSAHMQGLAVDFRIQDVPVLNVCLALPSLIEDYDQIIYYLGSPGWTHLGFAIKNPRFQLLSARRVLDGKRIRTVFEKGFILV